MQFCKHGRWNERRQETLVRASFFWHIQEFKGLQQEHEFTSFFYESKCFILWCFFVKNILGLCCRFPSYSSVIISKAMLVSLLGTSESNWWSITFFLTNIPIEKLFAGASIVSPRWARKKWISMILKNIKQIMSSRKLKQVPRGSNRAGVEWYDNKSCFLKSSYSVIVRKLLSNRNIGTL